MSPEETSSDRTDRQVGWLITVCSLVGIAGQVAPAAAQQTAMFAPWWTTASWIAVVPFVVMAALGRWLPMRVLRALWAVAPALVITLQVLSYAAYRGGEEGVVPWVWALEPTAVSLLVLTLRPAAAVGVAVASGLTVAASAWIFTGAVPDAVASLTPIHMSNVAFTALFLGIRSRLNRLRAIEESARNAAERRAQSSADAEGRAAVTRLVHDDVLSVLNAALLFRGEAPAVLRAEADHALRALSADHGPAAASASTLSAETAAEVIRARLVRIVPHASCTVRHTGAPVLARRADAIAGAAAEAARNALRHADATEIEFHIDVVDGSLSARVRDDGVGFDLTRAPAGRLGLRDSMDGRMHEIGGRLEIISSPGQGTEVRVSWTP